MRKAGGFRRGSRCVCTLLVVEAFIAAFDVVPKFCTFSCFRTIWAPQNNKQHLTWGRRRAGVEGGAIGSSSAGARVGKHALGATLAMVPMPFANIRWLFESFLSIGAIKMGVQGCSAQLQFLAPALAIWSVSAHKSVGKLPLLPYSAMLATTSIFTIYGFLLGNAAIWAPHVSGVVLSAAYTAIFLRHCPSDADWLPGGRSAHVLGLLVLAGAVGTIAAVFDNIAAARIIGLMGNAVCIAMYGGPLASIKTVLSERSTKSLPFAFGIVSLVNASLWFFYGAVLIKDPLIWFPNALGLSSGIMQMALFAKFGFSK